LAVEIKAHQTSSVSRPILNINWSFSYRGQSFLIIQTHWSPYLADEVELFSLWVREHFFASYYPTSTSLYGLFSTKDLLVLSQLIKVAITHFLPQAQPILKRTL